jgi:hypothetical protein
VAFALRWRGNRKGLIIAPALPPLATSFFTAVYILSLLWLLSVVLLRLLSVLPQLAKLLLPLFLLSLVRLQLLHKLLRLLL